MYELLNSTGGQETTHMEDTVHHRGKFMGENRARFIALLKHGMELIR